MHNQKKDFYSFFRDNFIPIIRFIEGYADLKEESMDIAQDGFMRVYERWNSFPEQENAKAFLYTIVRNLSLDEIRRRKAKHNYLSRLHFENREEDTLFLREVTRQETFRIINSAIDSLPTQSRKIIRLSMEGASVNEVAEKMEISPNTVKTLKKSAYNALRQKLSPDQLTLFYFITFL